MPLDYDFEICIGTFQWKKNVKLKTFDLIEYGIEFLTFIDLFV